MHIFTKLKNTTFFLVLLTYHIASADVNNDLLSKIQQNLKNIDKVAIEFSQTDKNNSTAFGKLLIQKPHFFRCNYYPPYPILIVGGKNYISMYDYSMETISRIDSKANVINTLFMGSFKNMHFKVTDIVQLPEYIILNLMYVENGEKVEAFFDRESLDLVKVVIFELSEPNVVINFDTPKTVKKFDKKLFEIRDPRIFGAPEQLNKEQIEQLYEYN